MCDGGERSHHLLVQAVQHQPKELLCVLLTALHGGWLGTSGHGVCVYRAWGFKQFDLVYIRMQ